jgi:hypothetical protein
MSSWAPRCRGTVASLVDPHQDRLAQIVGAPQRGERPLRLGSHRSCSSAEAFSVGPIPAWSEAEPQLGRVPFGPWQAQRRAAGSPRPAIGPGGTAALRRPRHHGPACVESSHVGPPRAARGAATVRRSTENASATWATDCPPPYAFTGSSTCLDRCRFCGCSCTAWRFVDLAGPALEVWRAVTSRAPTRSCGKFER